MNEANALKKQLNDSLVLIKLNEKITCFVVTMNTVEDENFKESAVPG